MPTEVRILFPPRTPLTGPLAGTKLEASCGPRRGEALDALEQWTAQAIGSGNQHAGGPCDEPSFTIGSFSSQVRLGSNRGRARSHGRGDRDQPDRNDRASDYPDIRWRWRKSCIAATD